MHEKTIKSKIIFILTPIIILATVNNLMGQMNIVGVVTNAKNIPIENVLVACPNMNIETHTNAKGEYSIELDGNCNKLLFKYKGHSITENIKHRSIINVSITENKTAFKSTGYRYNIMLNAGGPIVWGALSGSIFVTDFLSLDLGLGLGKFYGGTTAYFNPTSKNRNWQPYVGMNIAYFEEFMGPVSLLIYVPAGLRYLNIHGTSISFEVAFLGSNNDSFMLDTPIWGGIRFGKYF